MEQIQIASETFAEFLHIIIFYIRPRHCALSKRQRGRPLWGFDSKFCIAHVRLLTQLLVWCRRELRTAKTEMFPDELEINNSFASETFNAAKETPVEFA